MSIVSMTFSMTDLARAARKLEGASTEIERRMMRAIDEATETGVRKAKQTARVDLGTNRDSIRASVRRSAGRVNATIIADAPNSAVMERGRRPGAKMPPHGVLLGWMARHGIPADREFLLRRAIGRRGIKGDRNIERNTRALGPLIRRSLGEIGPTTVRESLSRR